MKTTKGFTLVEIAIVLLIVTILLGYSVAMLTVQQELKQYRQARQEMDQIIEGIMAFAQVEGYLPCPAWVDNPASPTVTSNGFECRDNDATSANCDSVPGDPLTEACDVWSGYVPGKTLGLTGRYSPAGLLLDPWGAPYRYQVTDTDVGGPSSIGEDFVFRGDMKNEGIANLEPDLVVCSADPSPGSAGSDSVCASVATTIVGAGGSAACSDPGVNCPPVVVVSTGKDKSQDTGAFSWVQRENLDGDQAFVSSTISSTAGAEYDDLVRWVAPNVLYSRMIEAGQLP
jgi:prepilin-type N-terminal cleavage/methylation domain-containing protein